MNEAVRPRINQHLRKGDMSSRPTLEQMDLGDGIKVWVQTVQADIAGDQLAQV